MFSAMTKMQDRGGLFFTNDECIHLVMVGLELFKAIVKPAELMAKLMAAQSAEKVFAFTYCETLPNYPCLARLECNSGCSLAITVVSEIARSCFRVFGKNVVDKANSDHRHKEVIKKRTGTDDGKSTRSRSNFKKQKLSGL